MDTSQNLRVESDGEQEWTRVDFVERRRSPYSHTASATELAHAPKPASENMTTSAPGAFPTDDTDSTAYSSGNAYSQASPDTAHAAPQETPASSEGTAPGPNAPGTNGSGPGASRARVPRPRQCRICLDSVHPTLQESAIPSIPGMAPQQPRYVYQDEEGGRLIHPCKCKGSAKYVHEACLRQWRMASSSSRNYWHCPTCGYNYNIERLTYARYIQSVPSQLLLTFLFFVIAMFTMGFIADPIINLYLDPWTLIGWGWSDESIMEPVFDDPENMSWFQHFFKGMAGLGVLGFVKFVIASPFQFFRMRVGNGGRRGAGGAATGRDRVGDLSWIVILLGIVTTLYGIYQGVRAVSRRTLMRTAERVLDIGGDNDDGDDDES